MATRKKSGKAGGSGKSGVNIVASFRHYITGEIIRAADHGHRGFPIGSNGKKRPKSK